MSASIYQTVASLRDEAACLLSSLIRLPTLPGREQPAIDLMRDWFERAGVPALLALRDDTVIT